ncbi:MAG: hypothetical protein AB7S77_03190 [Desulfatirhabdiaceae bacterium]
MKAEGAAYRIPADSPLAVLNTHDSYLNFECIFMVNDHDQGLAHPQE